MSGQKKLGIGLEFGTVGGHCQVGNTVSVGNTDAHAAIRMRMPYSFPHSRSNTCLHAMRLRNAMLPLKISVSIHQMSWTVLIRGYEIHVMGQVGGAGLGRVSVKDQNRMHLWTTLECYSK